MRYAIVDKSTQLVTNLIEWDGDLRSWSPSDGHEAYESEVASIGDAFKDGVLVPQPPLAPPPISAEQASAERDARLTEAAIRIAPLQDAVDLGDASPAEEAGLTAWKRYRIAVNRVHLQPGFPSAIVWPEMP